MTPRDQLDQAADNLERSGESWPSQGQPPSIARAESLEEEPVNLSLTGAIPKRRPVNPPPLHTPTPGQRETPPQKPPPPEVAAAMSWPQRPRTNPAGQDPAAPIPPLISSSPARPPPYLASAPYQSAVATAPSVTGQIPLTSPRLTTTANSAKISQVATEPQPSIFNEIAQRIAEIERELAARPPQKPDASGASDVEMATAPSAEASAFAELDRPPWAWTHRRQNVDPDSDESVEAAGVIGAERKKKVSFRANYDPYAQALSGLTAEGNNDETDRDAFFDCTAGESSPGRDQQENDRQRAADDQHQRVYQPDPPGDPPSDPSDDGAEEEDSDDDMSGLNVKVRVLSETSPAAWIRWRRYFEALGIKHNWSDERKNIELPLAMDGEAAAITACIPYRGRNHDEVMKDYEGKFITRAGSELAQTEFRLIRQQSDQSLGLFWSKCREAFERAYPTADLSKGERLEDICRAFCWGLTNEEITIYVWDRRPHTSYEQVLTLAQEKMSTVLAQAEARRNQRKGIHNLEERPNIGAVTNNDDSGVTCYVCEQKGHISTDCELKKGMEKRGLKVTFAPRNNAVGQKSRQGKNKKRGTNNKPNAASVSNKTPAKSAEN